MPKYILRLDDACPNMHWGNWKRMEEILQRYHIQPIVGVIPKNEDRDFSWMQEGDFWDLCRKWQQKQWVIAQHGYEHRLRYYTEHRKYFQLSHGSKTEFAGGAVDIQKEMLKAGYDIMCSQGVYPICFYAPCHTFDRATVQAINELNIYLFVSDGYGLKPYRKKGVLFLPSIFDSPHRGCGIMTFVLHPSYMKEIDFEWLEIFLQQYNKSFINAECYIRKMQKRIKGQGIIGKSIEIGMYCLRGMRKWKNIK